MKVKAKAKTKIKDVRLSLDSDFLDQLDKRARKEDVTRLSLIRKALALYLNEARERDEAYLKG
jgi:metal-responsive CopG/Arc/MetJ family transcriptional regulator